MTTRNMSLADVHALAMRVLSNTGFDTENATAIADRMIEAERDRCQSHGLFRLAWYVGGAISGRANPAAKPRLSTLAPGVVQVDGDGGYAPLAQAKAHDALVAATRQNGIAAAGITNMFHIAAMWPEVEALAREGLVAMAWTASYPYVAPAGGIKPLFGTNPMGFAWPRPGREPLVFDQASSAMARGEIQIAARDGHKVPESAGIGPNGEATTDPNVVLEGAQLGFGGYKGAALAMMVELLAGPLIGEFLSFEAAEDDAGKGGPPKGGELIIAMDPARFGDPENALAHGEKLFAEILGQEGTRLPGERRFKARAETPDQGIEVSEKLLAEIAEL